MSILIIDVQKPPLRHPNPQPKPSEYETHESDESYLKWIQEQEEMLEKRRSLDPNPHIVHEGMEYL